MAMQHMDSRRNTRNRLYNTPVKRAKVNWACCVLTLVIFVGCFMQIFALSQLMAQKKLITETSEKNYAIEQQVKNARNVLSQYTNEDTVKKQASLLGMVETDEIDYEIRCVPVHTAANNNSDTNAQTVYNGGNQ